MNQQLLSNPKNYPLASTLPPLRMGAYPVVKKPLLVSKPNNNDDDDDYEDSFGVMQKPMPSTSTSTQRGLSIETLITSVAAFFAGGAFVALGVKHFNWFGLKKTELDLIKKLQQELITDKLTGVYNRRFFDDKIEELLKEAKEGEREISLILLDIDHFKAVNTDHGYRIGDEVLSTVAGVLKEHTPEGGFCCRYGGEEFVILLPDTSKEAAKRVAETMRQAVQQTSFESAKELQRTISGGIATHHFGENNEFNRRRDDLVRGANGLLLKAKSSGKNQILS